MSVLLTKPNAFFLHVPRTGGTYIQEVLRRLGLKRRWNSRQPRHRLPMNHSLLGHYIAKKELQDIETIFAFVRHPVNYYESVWRYFKGVPGARRIRRWHWHPHQIVIEQWDDDFNLWVEKMLFHHPAWVTKLMELYVGPKGGEFCQFIGRTRSIKQDLVTVLSYLGHRELLESRRELLFTYPPINESPKIEVAWDPILKTVMLEQEHECIDRFFSGRTINRRWYAHLRKVKLRYGAFKIKEAKQWAVI